MSISMSLYLIDLVGNLNAIAALIFGISIFALLPSSMYYVDSLTNSHTKRSKIMLPINILILVSSALVLIVVPSRTTMQLIMINESLQKLAQQPKVEQLSDKLFKVLEVQLDKLSDTKKVEESYD